MREAIAIYRHFRQRCRMGRCRAIVKTLWVLA